MKTLERYVYSLTINFSIPNQQRLAQIKAVVRPWQVLVFWLFAISFLAYTVTVGNWGSWVILAVWVAYSIWLSYRFNAYRLNEEAVPNATVYHQRLVQLRWERGFAGFWLAVIFFVAINFSWLTGANSFDWVGIVVSLFVGVIGAVNYSTPTLVIRPSKTK